MSGLGHPSDTYVVEGWHERRPVELYRELRSNLLEERFSLDQRGTAGHPSCQGLLQRRANVFPFCFPNLARNVVRTGPTACRSDSHTKHAGVSGPGRFGLPPTASFVQVTQSG